ncbi:MAG: integrase, partial [Candidatus Parvarchaeota archaeon]
QLKAFFGRTGASSTAATYVHLSGRDIDNAVLAANDVKVQESAKETKLEVKECQKCKQSNAIDAMYCVCCGTPLDIKTETEAAKI